MIAADIATRPEDVDPQTLAGAYLSEDQVAALLSAPSPVELVEQLPPDELRAVFAEIVAPLFAATVDWHLISCLDALRDEVDAHWPKRDRGSDGTIGDAAHQQTHSDHNPDNKGRVLALDLDADGCPMAAIVAAILGDARLEYVIYKRVIWSRNWGWKPRAYTGSNPHTKHAHCSGRHDHTGESDRRPWLSKMFPGPAPAPRPKPKPPRNSPGTRVLRQGMTGPDVAYAQRYIGSAWCGRADGLYGPRTAGGVRRYQRMRRITADGIVGPVTWRQMGIRWRG